jgi:hypothetical protein
MDLIFWAKLNKELKMERNHKFYWQNGISLEQSPLSLVLNYSEPTPDKTVCYYHYRIPLSSTWPPTLETGESQYETSTQKINWEEIPDQVFRDALHWVNQQIEIANNNGKANLSTIFSRFKDKLEK